MKVSREKIETTVKETVADVMGIEADSINLTDNLVEDLEISSIEIFTLLPALEDTFHITIKEDSVREMFTVEDVANIIENLVK